MTHFQSYFRRLSLDVLYAVEKAIYTCDISTPAGLEARGEGRERGNLPVVNSEPAVAQRAGGINRFRIAMKCL